MTTGMNMDKKQDKAPGSRMVGKRRGGGVPEVIVASGAEVLAPATSSSSDGTRPFPPCTAGGGNQGTASAKTTEGSKGPIAPVGIRLGPEVVLIPAGSRDPIAPGTYTSGGVKRKERRGSPGGETGMGKGWGKGNSGEGKWYGGIDAGDGYQGRDEGVKGEEEITRLSLGSESDGSELEDETKKTRKRIVEDLGALIWNESTSPRDSSSKREAVSRMEWMLDTVIKEAEQRGYQMSRSIDRRQMEDLEELLGKERRRRKEIEEERVTTGNEVREILRREMEKIMNEYERRRMDVEERMWNERMVKIGEQMRKIMEEWEERRRGVDREETRKIIERTLRKRDDRIREEMGEWTRVVEERENGARELVRKDLEEILERREKRTLEREREDVKKMLKDWGREMDGAREEGAQERRGSKNELGVGKERNRETGTRAIDDGERLMANRETEFPPLRSHVVIRGGPERSYSEALRKARTKVSLDALGVRDIQVREGRDCIVISVGGGGSSIVAGSLAREIRGAAGDGITVSCPRRMAEVEVAGFDPSASAEEVKSALAGVCGVSPSDVLTGKIGRTRGGRARCWARLPLDGLHRLKDGVAIGWTRGHVHRLEDRPVQCFKCLGFGHIGRWCRERGVTAPTPGCFRCSAPGHTASRCSAPPRCLACEVRGWPTGHRMGGPQCRRLREGHPEGDNRAQQGVADIGPGQRKRAAEVGGGSPQGGANTTPPRAAKKGRHSPGGGPGGSGSGKEPPPEGLDPGESAGERERETEEGTAMRTFLEIGGESRRCFPLPRGTSHRKGKRPKTLRERGNWITPTGEEVGCPKKGEIIVKVGAVTEIPEKGREGLTLSERGGWDQDKIIFVMPGKGGGDIEKGEGVSKENLGGEKMDG